MVSNLNPSTVTSRSISVFRYISLVFALLSLIGCGQTIRSISAADNRLPNEAKERIADAEDAVLIARSRLQDTERAREIADQKSLKFSQQPPNLGSATAIARQLISARLHLASLEQSYAEVNHQLSLNRLKLVYAQTAMRYDIAVYDLIPLDQSVDGARQALLQLRRERKQARSKMKTLVDQWWKAYKGLAQSTGTQAFWVYEFTK